MAEIYLKRKKRHRTLDKRKKEAQAIYNTVRWKKLRAWKLMQDPLCQDCLDQEKTVPAIEVHHKVPWQRGKDKWDRIRLAYDSDNLRSLCLECHHRKHPNVNNRYNFQ